MTNSTTKKQAVIYILLFTTFFCSGTTTKVTRVIDGDTFETESGLKVRLIGINAPEIKDIFGHESRQYLSDLIENKTVDLQKDNFSRDKDKYNRLLRYVILDSTDINKKMISDGFALAYLKYQFNKINEYEQAQIQAKKMNSGMWADDNKKTIRNEQEKKESSFWEDISLKAYIVTSLITVLLFVGIYTYFKSF